MGKAKAKTAQTPEEQYAERVTEIRECRTQGAENELRMMLLILDLEKRPSLWRDVPKTSFATVVQRERFCTVHRWQTFKRAKAAIPKKHMETLGVPACCLIAAQPKRQHMRLLRLALDFQKEHGVEPTYQYIGRLVRKRKPPKPHRRVLLSYIESLKVTIKELGGQVPEMEA